MVVLDSHHAARVGFKNLVSNIIRKHLTSIPEAHNICIDVFVAEQIEHVKGNLEWKYISFNTL